MSELRGLFAVSLARREAGRFCMAVRAVGVELLARSLRCRLVILLALLRGAPGLGVSHGDGLKRHSTAKKSSSISAK